jgi:prepilin signal peptidase PulO-like enzyme (type II secretory pathway)
MAAEPVISDVAGVAVKVGSATAPRDDTPRSWRLSPAVIVLAAVVAMAAPLRLGVTPYGIMAAASLAVLVVLGAIDLQARILPNKILLPATAAIFAAQVAFYPERTLELVVAALVAAAVTLAPSLVNPKAMGMGDVKLVAFLGVLLGNKVVPAMMLGFGATAPLLAVLLVTRGREARRTALPLGPFLALGAAVVILA